MSLVATPARGHFPFSSLANLGGFNAVLLASFRHRHSGQDWQSSFSTAKYMNKEKKKKSKSIPLWQQAVVSLINKIQRGQRQSSQVEGTLQKRPKWKLAGGTKRISVCEAQERIQFEMTQTWFYWTCWSQFEIKFTLHRQQSSFPSDSKMYSVCDIEWGTKEKKNGDDKCSFKVRFCFHQNLFMINNPLQPSRLWGIIYFCCSVCFFHPPLFVLGQFQTQWQRQR